MRANLPLEIEEGSMTYLSFVFVGPQHSRVDLTALTPRLEIRDSSGGSLLTADRDGSPVSLSFWEDGNFLQNLLTTGEIRLYLPADFEYAFDQAVYDLVLIAIAETALTPGTTQVLAGGLGKAEFRAAAGEPYTGLEAGDIVRITGSENGGENDGSWLVDSVGSSGVSGNSGSSFKSTYHTDVNTYVVNAADSTLDMTYIDVDETDTKYMERFSIRLAGGPVKIKHRVTE